MARRAQVRPPTRPPSPEAFIFYRPDADPVKAQVSCTHGGWQILSPGVEPPDDGAPPTPDLLALCTRWKKLLDAEGEQKYAAGLRTVDLYESWRRRYAVKGAVLSSDPLPAQHSQPHDGPYLFILERFSPDAVNLAFLARHWRLNRRECEIVQLLLTDKSNKEMAGTLGLSLNTVKGYLKLLTRKLGVSSRTGIIARLFVSRAPS